MRNNKAIELLDNLIGMVEDNHGSDYDKAIHMAIDALTADMDDVISRQVAIDAVKRLSLGETDATRLAMRIEDYLERLQSAQPERTCVTCGRTVNNGGWYADGRTRCPIEEHYALPKDGYCHLWEKRNITDDDYPERREE